MARKAPRVVRHPAAIADLIEIADHLARASSVAMAERFLASAERAFDLIARMPRLGSRWESDSPRLAEVRFFPISRFRNHLIFYRPLDEGVEVLRVLHGARDIARLLEARDDPI